MMLLAERAGRKLERRSNSAPRGMTVMLAARRALQNPAYRAASHCYRRLNFFGLILQIIQDGSGPFCRQVTNDSFHQFTDNVTVHDWHVRIFLAIRQQDGVHCIGI